MRRAGMPRAACDGFAQRYAQLVAGDAGQLPGDALEPVADVRRLDDLVDGATARMLDRRSRRPTTPAAPPTSSAAAGADGAAFAAAHHQRRSAGNTLRQSALGAAPCCWRP
jgi:hypothetical protein